MERYAASLIEKYLSAGVLVDTNILLLYLVGAHDPGRVKRFKRTRDRFDPEDFDTLLRLLEAFARVIVTPHILTETSNLLGQMNDPAKTACFELFARAIGPAMHEAYTPATTLSESPAFVLFGIADASILEAAWGSYLVLTDDPRLAAYLQSRGVDVLNFNNIRTLGYG